MQHLETSKYLKWREFVFNIRRKIYTYIHIYIFTHKMTQDESIMTKVQKVENMLNESMYKLEVLKKTLTTKLLTMQTREELETKLEEVREELEKNEEKLKNLRRQNTKSFMLAASLIFACFLLYGLYLMLYGTV